MNVKRCLFLLLICYQLRIQDFPEEGMPTVQGGANIRFCQIFPKTAWNWKNLDPQGGRVSKMLLSRSTTGYRYIRFYCERLFTILYQKCNKQSSSIFPVLWHHIMIHQKFVKLPPHTDRSWQLKLGCVMFCVHVTFFLAIDPPRDPLTKSSKQSWLTKSNCSGVPATTVGPHNSP